MKLRYKILYISFWGMLVVLGMVLNSLVSGDADAQVGVEDAEFGYITCKGLIIKIGDKVRGYFGLDSGGDAILEISDDGKTIVAYLGKNKAENNEIMLQLQSKSKTDKREVMLAIDENGGRFDGHNKMGEAVVRVGVVSDGGGVVDTRDKFGYKR